MSIENSTNKILSEVLNRACVLICNQARYQWPLNMLPTNDPDSWCAKADNMTDEQTFEFIKGKPILDSTNVLNLIATIGVEDLYCNDRWIDIVADYVIQHRESCDELHKWLLATEEQQ